MKTIKDTVQNFEVTKSPFRICIWMGIKNSVKDSVYIFVLDSVSHSVWLAIRKSVYDSVKEKLK